MVAMVSLQSMPLRRLAAGTLVSAIGNGAWYTTWALFLTHSVGLAPAEVGVGMTIAAGVGAVCATPLGRLGDRLGPREVFAVELGLQGLAAGAFALVHDMASFLVVACIAQTASSGSGGPRNALVLGLSGDGEPAAALAELRAISHIGWAIGAVAGAVALGIDTRPAYIALVLVNGVSYLLYMALVLGVPPVQGRSGAAATSVVRDLPYLTLAGLVGVLALCWAMLSSAVPLWVTLHTHAPRAISGIVVLVSCLGIAAFQVRACRRITAVRTAARAAVLSGGALATSCMLFALTAGGAGWSAVALILVAAGCHVAGELLFVAASWGLSIPLMPPGAPGEYQGAFSTGESLALMVAPALMTTLVAGWGQPGWFVLAGLFLAPALAVIPAARWAVRTRPACVGAAPRAAPASGAVPSPAGD